MTVGAGEIVALLGANGAGKSTLLKTISGVLRPRRGDIRFSGVSVVGRPPFQLVRAGLVHVPEGRHIFASLTVLENLQLGGTARSDRSSVDRDLEWMFEVFPDLHAKRHHTGRELSGGQQQMLAIARGLMSAPRLLCLDEPSLGLSPRLCDDLSSVVERIWRERQTGILIVEQNAAMALALAQRAYVLQRGVVVRSGTSSEIREASDLKEAYLGSARLGVNDTNRLPEKPQST